mmetsp:Transcript_13722/g.59905  ORF Transcript_13722/g.59905 Transcript_13722/m.59905 type:complete len:369 (+) Transcript_13722:1092-2198(+)
MLPVHGVVRGHVPGEVPALGFPEHRDPSSDVARGAVRGRRGRGGVARCALFRILFHGTFGDDDGTFAARARARPRRARDEHPHHSVPRHVRREVPRRARRAPGAVVVEPPGEEIVRRGGAPSRREMKREVVLAPAGVSHPGLVAVRAVLVHKLLAPDERGVPRDTREAELVLFVVAFVVDALDAAVVGHLILGVPQLHEVSRQGPRFRGDRLSLVLVVGEDEQELLRGHARVEALGVEHHVVGLAPELVLLAVSDDGAEVEPRAALLDELLRHLHADERLSRAVRRGRWGDPRRVFTRHAVLLLLLLRGHFRSVGYSPRSLSSVRAAVSGRSTSSAEGSGRLRLVPRARRCGRGAMRRAATVERSPAR